MLNISGMYVGVGIIKIYRVVVLVNIVVVVDPNYCNVYPYKEPVIVRIEELEEVSPVQMDVVLVVSSIVYIDTA